jgi:hypothetical protein
MSLPPPVIHLTNNVKVMVDGKQIAAAIEAEIVQKYEHPTQAAYHDPYLGYSAPDQNFATG